MKTDILKIKLGLFETIWFITALVILIISSLLLEDTLLGTITTLTGMLNVLLVAKRSMWNYLFGIINVLLYAYIAYISNYGGDFVTFMFYYFPLQFIGIYSWRNHIKVEEDNAEVETVALSIKGWIILIINLILGTYLITLLLPFVTALFGMGSNPLPIIDGFTTYAGITAGVLMVMRYSEQWIIWVLVNVGSVIMWISMLGVEPTAPAMIIMWSAFLINSLYGLLKWYKK